MGKSGLVLLMVLLGVIAAILLLVGQRSCLGAIQALPTRVVVITATPVLPTATQWVVTATPSPIREVVTVVVTATPEPTNTSTVTSTPVATATSLVVQGTQVPQITIVAVTATSVPMAGTPAPGPVCPPGQPPPQGGCWFWDPFQQEWVDP